MPCHATTQLRPTPIDDDHLSGMGAKTRTRDMANSAAIATFHKNGRLA